MPNVLRFGDGSMPDSWRFGDGTLPDKVMLGDGTQIWPLPPPVLSSVSPGGVGVAGGDTVTLTGLFFAGVTGVTIGGTAATSVVTVNDTTIRCVAPAKSAGVSQVIVNSTRGPSNSVALTYTSFTNKSMTKSGSQTMGSTGSNNLITGWTGGNTGNALVVVGSAPATIDLTLGFSGSVSSSYARIYINGTLVANGPTGSGSSFTATWSGALNNGDVIESYFYKNTSSGRNCTSGNMSVTKN